MVAADTPSPLPRRGRKPKYRDLSQRIEGAKLRKRAQRDRERAAGLATVEFRLPDDLLASLAATAVFTFTDPKQLAAHLVASSLPAYRRHIERLSEDAGRTWSKALPYLHHAADLANPGNSCRIGGRTLTHAQWARVSADLERVRSSFMQLGWGRTRIDRFLRRSAERLRTNA